LYLPHTLGLFASDCNGKRWDSPHYDPYLHAINMCYSYILASEREADWFVEYQKKRELPTPVSRDQYLAGLFTAVLLHETGHALFDQLNIPIFGREEDAADEIAAFIALQFDKRTARTVIKGFAYTWTLQRNPPLAAPNTQDPKYPTDPEQQCALDPICAYSDEHGTASQRMYNTLCIAFGGDPSDFQELVDSGWLPKERASHCADEYNQIAFAFQKTIYPFINVDQMKKVQARKWFMPQEEDLTPH
jgi:hypothetical protein